ncbi:uncharacterized protein LOC114806571 isoform X2 [Ornithorhynchus anatinus]|uniref:uncharacterized protein LOC114806571 isoform X2 n=1 Tax=Ornithorhynchus anatinus TaxID=9258 RepID=UPI0010A7D876|nr:uncharacterized protein LOC114806571 isoform X2 [Ornithorhynchus anatinus]
MAPLPILFGMLFGIWAATPTETPEIGTATLSTMASTETPKTVTTALSTSTHGTRLAISTVETQTVTSLQPGTTSAPKSPQNSGQVVVFCLFSSVLLIALLVISVKYCHKREPVFRKLDEVPMENLTEELPFARYSPD